MSKSVKSKLFISLLLVSIIPLFLISTIVYFKTNQGFQTVLEDNQHATKETISTQLNNLSQDLLTLTKAYANNQEILESFQRGDREQLALTVQPIFERLQNEHQVDVFEFGTVDGEVFFRGHNPEKFGDDKSDKPAIQAALREEEITGFEFGNSGLAVRAFVPLMYENKIIGTLQTGLNGGAIESITGSLKGVQLNIMDTEGQILVATEQQQVGTLFEDTSILQEVIAGKEVKKESEHYYQLFIPLYDPTNTEVIGLTQIKQDITVIKTINHQIYLYLLIVGLATLVAVVITAYFLSRGFSQPIKQITSIMREISKGNLNNEVIGKSRKDEFGQLSKSILSTQSNLKEMIETISQLSKVVKEQATFMKQSCIEITSGSNQIASAIQELSTGADQQANSSTIIAENMDTFSNRIIEVNENGSLIVKASSEVLSITETGNGLMNQSMEQMNRIYEIVTEAVQKVQGLDRQSKEISNLVTVINTIAEQTNLLALNAAIEAARAGEHGKGFAVVAGEVRKLAEQVSQSIHDITGIVNNIQTESNGVVESLTKGYQEVEEGTNQIKVTRETFERINQAVIDMVSKIQTISTNLTEIQKNSKEINESIETNASISQESAASIEETSASVQQTNSSIEHLSSNADSLENLSNELQTMVGKFKF
ncbi:methyl-accepting chemotaxis protein [Halalkalibacter urbisdiaboli]|uniref:methyl-accepting chemotaxis protein n=1 Tax=Halalkalibacter urbisdiaboli TaxID=1960589 RepID=UPI0010541958|nr:methyl-accepting chemotaxis protein [Halalkalibacter urbisdiaboli]